MRSDMDKVIVERPRRCPNRHTAPGYHRRLQRIPAAELPRREGIFELRGKTKFFNEHLSPLRRFLRSRVGCPWNRVFAEICENLRQDSAIQSHVRDHLWDYVERNVVERDGQLYYGSGWHRGWPLSARRWDTFYVCPRTGFLRLVPRRKRVTPDVVRRAKHRHYRRVRGEWFELQLREVPGDEWNAGCFDAWLSRPVSKIAEAELRRQYGGDRSEPALYAHAVRRVSGAEARKLSREARGEKLKT